MLETYVRKFPKSIYSEFAQARIRELKRPKTSPNKPPQSPKPAYPAKKQDKSQVALVTPPPKPPKPKPSAVRCDTKAKSAIVMVASSNTALCEKNADDLVPPASMSKLMTLAVVFDLLKAGKLRLDDEFVISENAWRRGGAPSGSASMFVKLKSKVKLRELLPGIIVQSANDAAIAVAEGISGSEKAFAELMTAHARKIGLSKSTFGNATGFTHPKQ